VAQGVLASAPQFSRADIMVMTMRELDRLTFRPARMSPLRGTKDGCRRPSCTAVIGSERGQRRSAILDQHIWDRLLEVPHAKRPTVGVQRFQENLPADIRFTLTLNADHRVSYQGC